MFSETKYGRTSSWAPRVSPERNMWVKRESAQLLERNLRRDKTKLNIRVERQKKLGVLNKEREQRIKWLGKQKHRLSLWIWSRGRAHL